MINQKFCIHTKQFVKQIFIIIICFFSDGAARHISHGIHSVFCQFLRISRSDTPEIRDRPVVPKQFTVTFFILLGTNVLTADNDYSSFLTYYRLMLDMISQALPNTKIYVQSITPVRPEVSQKSPGLYKQRLCEINDALSAIALEKGCTFLNLWEALADENGDLIAEYAQPDGYHLLPAGYDAWVEYLCTHT